MVRIIWPAAAFLLGSLTLAQAQAPATVSSRPALVRAWHRQFFHRQPEPRSVAGWSYWFRLGNSPQTVLAAMLSTDEYYRRAGQTPEGFVKALFEDGTLKRPTAAARQTWINRARSLDRRSLAAAFIREYPEALLARPNVANLQMAGRPDLSTTARARRPQPSRRPKPRQARIH